MNPRTPIVVQVAHGQLHSVSVTNTAGRHVTGTFRAGKTYWSSTEVLGYDKTYRVTAAAAGTDGTTVRKNASVRTLTPRAQAYPSVIPAPDISSFGVGQPLAVVFDRAVPDKAAAQKALHVISQPAQSGSWYWLSDRQVDFRPEHFWRAGTKLTLQASVYGVNLGNGVYGQTDRTIHYSVHDSWVAIADANTFQMRIEHNGRLVKTMPVSMGKKITPTHNGIHVIQSKYREYTMNSCTYGVCSGPDAYISREYWAERISNDGEFVHENPKSVGDQGNSNVSHGCINLNETNAIWFYRHFGIGDVVEAVNSPGPPLPLYDTWGDWSLPWPEWQAGNARS